MNVRSLRRRIPLFGVAVLAVDCSHTVAQEALGEAREVERARRERQQALDRNLFSTKAGPVFLRFDAVMGFEVNDNPQLVEHPKQVDFGFRPQLDIGTLWPLNQHTALGFNLGIGYVKYVHNTDLDHVIIAPNSELSFDVSSGDVTVNFHERLGYTQDPMRDPTVSGTGDFGGLDNTVGFRVDWDLNQLLLSAGYDHANFFAIGNNDSKLSKVQESSQELFYGSAGFKLNSNLRAGLELSGGLTDYETDVFADNTQFSAGPYVEVDFTKEFHGRASAGYVRYDFDSPKPSGTNVVHVPDSVDGIYADVTLRQELSQFISHQLSIGREARSGAASELVTLWYARYGNDWQLSKDLTLHTLLIFEDGHNRAGFNNERFWRAGGGAGVSVPLSRKLSATLSYQILYKDSDQPRADYLQNVAVLNFKYVF